MSFLGKIPLNLHPLLHSKVWFELYSYEFDLPGIPGKSIWNTTPTHGQTNVVDWIQSFAQSWIYVSLPIDTTRSSIECYIGGSTSEEKRKKKLMQWRWPAKVEPDIVTLTTQDSDLCGESLRNRTGVLSKIISETLPRRSQDSKGCLLRWKSA